jgi:phage/plasmid-associated DNA primase
MTNYFIHRDGQFFELNSSYSNFKQFKKDFNSIVSDGYSAVFQRMQPECNVISKMRYEFDESAGFNVIDTDVIGRLAWIHQNTVKQMANIVANSNLTCFVMTHPQGESNGKYYEEIYFQMPYVKMPVADVMKHLIPSLKHFFTETDIHVQGLEITPINSIDEMISDDFYKIGLWPLPGSYLNGQLLTITYVFDYINDQQMEERQFTGYPPEAYFSNYQIPDNSEYEYSNSFFFTNLEGFEAVKRKKTQHEKNRDLTTKLIEERQKEIKRTQGEMCKIFLDMLNPERFANEASRNKVGQVLFNVLRGADEGLKLWIEYIEQKLEALNNSFPTRQEAAIKLSIPEDEVDGKVAIRMSDFDLGNVIETIKAASSENWQYFEYTDCTIGTLRYWAKLDNPESYKSFVQKDVTTLAWKCLNSTSSHTDVAKLVHAKYSEQFACAHIKDNLWFGYWNHRWHELDTGHTLRIKLSEELPPIFEKILNECSSEYKKAIGDEDKEKWAKLMTACARMIKDLKTVGFKNNIMKECAEKFYDEDFIQKLDEDRCILGLPNGVYELETDTFRPGKPEDFITLSTKAKYNPNYNWEHPRVKEVVYYFKTVYPDRELRHYTQKGFGTILEGGNMNKDFYNMVGEGDNSKSMMAKLLRLALGKYIGKLPVSMIMGKRGGADNATPHLADKKGVRALFVEEPPKGQSNVSVVKELSGNDDILSRALFKMPIVFSPQWKLFVFTNHLLEAPAEEKAYWNRQKVIDHESTFSFDAPLVVEDQFRMKVFPRDPFFDRKLVAMAEPLLWCLIQWYKIFKEEGLKPPARVVEATNAAKMRNDIYMQYIRSSLDNGTQHDVITVDSMYEDFKGWHNSAGVRSGIPTRFEFEDEMSKVGHLGNRPIGQKWLGIKFRQKITQLPVFDNGQQQFNAANLSGQRLVHGLA